QSFSVTNFFNVYVVSGLPPGGPQTNVVGSNSISWLAVVVPTNAIYATNIVPGGIYFLGVQNTNSVPVTNAIEVDFALALPLSLPVIPDQVVTAGDTLIVTNTATDSSAGAVLVYNLFGSGAAAGGSISASGIITWITTTNIAPTNVV